MYKEALLKPKPATPVPASPAAVPVASPATSSQDSTPMPSPSAKLPSVEYFANCRATSQETHSVTSTENTGRSKGLTPCESWADDDDEFVASLHVDDMRRVSQQSRIAKEKERGWKEVAPTRGQQLSQCATTAKAKPTTSVPPANIPNSTGRFEALAPEHAKRWR